MRVCDPGLDLCSACGTVLLWCMALSSKSAPLRQRLLCCLTLRVPRWTGTGWQAIQDQIAKLEKRHAVHIAAYGEGNERRLTGAPTPCNPGTNFEAAVT